MMSRFWMLCVVAMLFVPAYPVAAQNAQPAPINWDAARQLLQKERNGQALTPDEKVYLDRAKRERQAQQAGAATRPSDPQSKPALEGKPTTGLVPLNQMTAADRYKGQDGGLYGEGKNDPPRAHAQAAQKELAKIVPLDKDGKPAADGKVVLLCIGMSNATQEFSRFKPVADQYPDKSPALVIVDGAQGGQASAEWAKKKDVWQKADERLATAGVTPQQVQVIWMKHALINQGRYGDFPAHAEEMKKQVITVLQLTKERYPNARIVYLASRTYGGYATGQLNPEPYAYEGAYALRWVIQDQINGSAALNCDPAKGEVKAPLLLWGPYLWADGTAGRKSDGLVYVREDFGADGVHPTAAGRDKVTQQLLSFFKTNPNAKSWFLK